MWIFLITLLFSIIAVVIAWSFKGYSETIDVRGKSVFISGCDTGFGYGLALRLDKLGMKVFAGCLTTQGAQKLRSNGSAQLEALICDITKPEDIETTANIISSICPEGLYFLVNNAGITSTGEWEWFPEKHLRQVMEVNFFGHVAVTKAFLPQIKKTRGRIVNVTSVGGYVAHPMRGGDSCSKFAMEAFSDSLRRGMKKWGVSVLVVEPAFVATEMVKNYRDIVARVWDDASDDHKREYGKEYGDELLNLPLPRLDPLELVLDALQSKITAKYPTLRSRVGKLATLGYIFTTFLPTSWADRFFSLLIKAPTPASLKKK